MPKDSLESEISERVAKKDSRIIRLGWDGEGTLQRLHGLGYSKLYGVSSHRSIYDQAQYTSIRYLYCGTADTHYPQGFFDCCVAPSASSNRDLGYVSEILRDGGLAFVKASEGLAEVGLKSEGTVPGGLTVCEKLPASRFGRTSGEKEVSILSYSSDAGGIGEYGRLLASRLSAAGMKVEVVTEPAQASSPAVIIEYANGLAAGARLPADAAMLSSKGKRIVVEVHDTLERFSPEERAKLQETCALAYRANEAADRDRVRRYFLMPHVSYTSLPLLPFEAKSGITLGSFGFAAKYKRTGMLIELARRLKVPLNLMVSLNTEIDPRRSLDSLKEIEPVFGCPLPGEGEYTSGSLSLRVGFFDPSEISREMAACSHIVFAHASSNFQQSGVMTMAKRFSRPVVATDSFQAKQAQVLRTRFVSRSDAMADSARTFGAFLRHGHVELRRFFGELSSTLTEGRISTGYLAEHSRDLPRDEDGLDYVLAILGSAG